MTRPPRARLPSTLGPVRLALSSLLALGCAGGKPAVHGVEGGGRPGGEAVAEKKGGDGGNAAAKKPEKKGKYPPPFFEPDCTSVATDGYLPDAKKVMASVRQANWSKLKACAEAAGPDGVSGEIRTTFRLDPDGVPRCVEAPGASVANEDVVNCVLMVYRSFRFSTKPKGGSVRVTDGIRLDVSEDDD